MLPSMESLGFQCGQRYGFIASFMWSVTPVPATSRVLEVLYVKLVPAQPGPGMPWLDRCSIPQVSYTTIYDDIHMIHCNTSNSPWP